MTDGSQRFRKSSFCRNNGCVEVTLFADGRVGMRSSKNMQLPLVTFSADGWREFVARAKLGEFG